MATSPNPEPSPAEANDPVVRLGAYETDEWINSDDIIIDLSYQRSPKMPWARKIAKRFDPSMFGRPIVARRRDGIYALIDGQHRLIAARIFYKGQPIILRCRVVNVNGVTEEAKLYRACNIDTVKTTSFEKFKAQITEGDAESTDILRIVRKHGFEIQLSGGRQRDGKFACVGALETIYGGQNSVGGTRWAKRGPELLDEVMSIVREAWEGATEGVGSIPLMGLAGFLNRYWDNPKYERRFLIDALRRTSAFSIDRDTKAAMPILKVDGRGAASRVILAAYNNKRTVNRLPEWNDVRA